MHRFSTAAAKPSTLPVLRDPQAGAPRSPAATHQSDGWRRDTKPGEGVSSLSAGEPWTPRWQLLISVIR